MSVLTLAPTETERLQAGDRIVALDDTHLTPAHIVAAPASPDGTVPLINLIGSGTTWRLYPDSQIAQSLTIERDDPAPAPPRRPFRRTRHGLTLVRVDEERWITEDGRYVVDRQGGYLTECEHPHPVKLTAGRREAIRAAIAYSESQARQNFGDAAVDAVRAHKAGYVCEGGQEHEYALWTAWPADTTGQIAAGGDPVTGRNDKLDDTWQELANHLARGSR